FFRLDVIIAIVVAGLMVGFFTDKPAIGQFDYMAAALSGIMLFAAGLALAGFPESLLSPMVIMSAGGLMGCVGYHLYKEHMR
ncbi:MAG: hypothetical protein AAFW60_12235, partial [Pseudomonadota bacterium]